ncbi:hypothetical protein LBMAG27_24070 [Bacteroidota bacterium]|nr:hypothetical protein LBMAG27_24070 [Bacteroidota bacterium]
MNIRFKISKNILLGIFFSLGVHNRIEAQNTLIKGFVDVTSTYQDPKISFGLGEQDLFITSEVSNRIDFLGESVFKYSATSPTLFDLSIERVVIKYNFYRNHNLLIGKHHTPINYWNDTYHHGRVFFPTIYRPDLFTEHIIPLHTTGISLQGHDLGKLKFGYDLLAGNGIGSTDIIDNDLNISFTAAGHIKPIDNLQIGASLYIDHISKGAKKAHSAEIVKATVQQQLLSGSASYFGKHFEILTEGTYAMDHTDTTGNLNSLAAYVYAGVHVKEKLIPYIRFDYMNVPMGEMYFHEGTKTTFVGGLRYEINYLVVVKLEFQQSDNSMHGSAQTTTAQIAIGF